MPVPELMTWIASQKRWVKMYCGRRYYISCRQLGVKPETKEASIQAANQWWRDKQSSIDLAEKLSRQQSARTPQPMEDLLASLLGSGPWTSQEDIARAAVTYLDKLPPSNAAETLAEEINYATYREAEHGDEKAWDNLASTLGRWLLPKLLERTILNGEPLPDTLKEHLSPARNAAVERAVKEMRGEQAADPARTVGALKDDWLLAQKHQVAIKAITAARYRFLNHAIDRFAAFLGETADISTVDAKTLEGFYHFCLSKFAEQRDDGKSAWSVPYAKQVFAVAKQWVKRLAENGAVSLPTNFNRRWSFGPTVKRIETWTMDEVQSVLAATSGKLKLCILLCLNCGTTQQDVSDLLDIEIDWRAGRVIRKRSKTRHREDTPEVNYKLWPSTFRLLKEHRSGQERVLLTKTGQPFVYKRLEGNKYLTVDSFGNLFRAIRRRCGVRKPLKLLRKTSASLLESHETYGRFTSLFLGHSPKSMKDKHYAAPPQQLFDAAVTWLGEKLGVAD